jgi:carboxypeptidase C (cathepsin A)
MIGLKQCRVLLTALIVVAILAISCSATSDRLRFHKIATSTLRRGAANLQTTIEGPEQYSGYFKLNRTYDAHMFFFYFQARTAPEAAPVILWMTGGPGCSSELAVFYENGPYTINEDMTLEDNPTGWDVAANMICK